jgi:CheY-like chemotaxis protein
MATANERELIRPAQADAGDEGTGADDRPRRVLIVDDDPDFLAMAEASLAAHGFSVERAAGGLRGVFLATQDVPDVVLCDLRMPGIDGFVVADALRADPATQNTAIFACTARRDLEARAALHSSAFDGVLVKPVDWDVAARLFEEAISVRRLPERHP